MVDDNPSQFEELQRRIREVAYLMWEAAGAQHGRALEFWLAAEREVLRQFATEHRDETGAPPATTGQDSVASAAAPSTDAPLRDRG